MLLLLQSILNNYSDDEILQMCKTINKDYNIYDPEDVRWAKIGYVLNKTNSSDIELLRKTCLSNKVVNDMIFNYYFCERVIKYYFIKHLKGQMQDYLRTFQKVYVIVPIGRVNDVKNLIPESCGIISYRITKNREVVFSYQKCAQKNCCDIKFCLDSLSSGDMSYFLKLLNEKDFKTRADKRTRLLQIAATRSIWTPYRKLLRHKYADQWRFITEHFDQILPVDIQSFFSSKMDPNLLYAK